MKHFAVVVSVQLPLLVSSNAEVKLLDLTTEITLAHGIIEVEDLTINILEEIYQTIVYEISLEVVSSR